MSSLTALFSVCHMSLSQTPQTVLKCGGHLRVIPCPQRSVDVVNFLKYSFLLATNNPSWLSSLSLIGPVLSSLWYY